jgi:hypothetical protein
MKRLIIFGLMALLISCDDPDGDSVPVATDSDGRQSTDAHGDTVDTDSGVGVSDTSSESAGQSETGTDDFSGTDFSGTETHSEALDTGTSGSATDSDTNVANDTGSDSTVSTDTLYYCPEGTQMHTSSSGKVVCCSESKPVFCDENEDGYTGSCWSEGVNCDSITFCGDVWRGCLTDRLPFCDPTGNMICYPCPEEAEVYWTLSQMPVCCNPDQPVFCDENDNGYAGGCWPPQIDCNTITMCNGYWGACSAGGIPACEGTRIVCQ